MFDGQGEDFDLQYAAAERAIPQSVGGIPISRSSPRRPSVQPRQTTLSRNRAASSDLRRETVQATGKDIDELRLAMRKLDNKYNELESRVRYVNPWAVQHMWEVLLRLQERVGGLGYHMDPRDMRVFGTTPNANTLHASPTFVAKGGDDRSDPYRSCSPLTPLQRDICDVEASAATLEVSSSFTVGGAERLSAYHRKTMLLWQESVGRQLLAVEQASERARVMAAMAASVVNAQLALHAQSREQLWCANNSANDETPTTPVRFFGHSRFQQSHAAVEEQSTGPQPKLRSKFVHALITDDGFTERVKYLLADFVRPILATSQQHFIAEAEKWMHHHTTNLQHEAHENMKRINEAVASSLSSITAREEALHATVERQLAEAHRVAKDHVTVVDRLRSEVLDASDAIHLKLQKMSNWREELFSTMEATIEQRLGSLTSTLERIGDHQDLIQRRLDDVQSKHVMLTDGALAACGGNSSATAGDGLSLAACDGKRLVQAVAYLDGMLLAPSAAADAGGGTSASTRLEDSVLLYELRATLAKLWDFFCHGGNSKTGAVGLSLEDLVQRPSNLFSADVITKEVAPFVMRHSAFSLRAECARASLPPYVARGLEGGWLWLTHLCTAAMLRRFVLDDDKEDVLHCLPPMAGQGQPLHRIGFVREYQSNDYPALRHHLPAHESANARQRSSSVESRDSGDRCPASRQSRVEQMSLIQDDHRRPTSFYSGAQARHTTSHNSNQLDFSHLYTPQAEPRYVKQASSSQRPTDSRSSSRASSPAIGMKRSARPFH